MQKFLKRAAVVAVMMSAMSQAQQERGYWRALSKTANAITGDVDISEVKISINFYTTALADIRSLQPAEVNAVFSSNEAATGTGELYRMSIPGSKKFLHKNTLCGGEDAQWAAVYVSGKTMNMAIFSGAGMPVFTPEAIAGSTNLCGTFSYVR